MAPHVSIVLALSFLLAGIASAMDDEFGEMAFSYSGLDGPNRWGRLDPTFAPCSSGKKQSPINIVRNMTELSKSLKPLDRNYKPAKASIVNKGYSVGVRFDEFAGDLSIDGKSYTLKQIHWHTPSEHRIDGKEFAAELHMVHTAADNSIAVVGVLYQQQENNPDPLICKITDALKHLGKANSEVPIGTFDTNELNRRSRKYYRYYGSLTTPPCKEMVTWSILGKVMSISREQIAILDAPLNADCKRNARPCQLLNGRHVELYDELQCS